MTTKKELQAQLVDTQLTLELISKALRLNDYAPLAELLGVRYNELSGDANDLKQKIPSGFVAALFARAFLDTFEQGGATNFLRIFMNCPMPNNEPNVELEVLIQRRDRKSPAELLDEAKAYIRQLEATIDDYRGKP